MDVQLEVEIMEQMAEAWKAIEAQNARHESQKPNKEKPVFCMDRCAILLASIMFPGMRSLSMQGFPMTATAPE